MQLTNDEWTETEENIARKAFETAYQREINDLMDAVKHKAVALAAIEDMWHLHDFLSAKRHEVDGKYDYCLPMLVFVFAGLVKDGWLNLSELDGLNPDKIAKISALSRM
ncbi:MAG: hypothetical protein ACKPCM_19755 [Pseudanabaena sp.]